MYLPVSSQKSELPCIVYMCYEVSICMYVTVSSQKSDLPCIVYMC